MGLLPPNRSKFCRRKQLSLAASAVSTRSWPEPQFCSGAQELTLAEDGAGAKDRYLVGLPIHASGQQPPITTGSFSAGEHRRCDAGAAGD
jgi:hypothetical protein